MISVANDSNALVSMGNTFYKSILDQARDIILVVAADGAIIDANQAAVIAYGYSLAELRLLRVHDLRALALSRIVNSQLQQAQREGILFRTVHLRKNGDCFPVEVSSRKVQLPDYEAIISIVRDVTEAIALETDLKVSEEKLRLQTEKLTEANEELTAAYEELAASEEELRQQFDELLSRDQEIRKQNSVLTLFHEMALRLMHRTDTEELLKLIIAGATELTGSAHGFIYRLDKQRQVFRRTHGLGIYASDIGREIPVNEGIVGAVYRSGQPVAVSDYSVWRERYSSSAQLLELRSVLQIPLMSEGQVIGTIGLGYCEEKQVFSQGEIDMLSQFAELASIALDNALLIASLKHLAYYDSLTGLPNRVYLHECLHQELEKAAKGEALGALLNIDLDDLSSVNDTLGHSCGDDVIVKAGASIVCGAGEHALVARVAGDEFMILLVGESGRERVASIADRVIKQLGREYEIGEVKVHMSGSIGIALYPSDGISAADILKKADLALYMAKKSGKNTWRFCEEKSQIIAYEKMMLKRALREAVRREELALHYQPLIDAKSNRVVSFEALLRWTSAEHGIVPPDRFIPLAEENDTIREIGQWVIEEACRFAARLKQLGRGDIRVSVNVSPRQLVADDFVDKVRQTIEREAINSDQLEIEITESVLIDSLEDSIRKLSELYALGVRLALDDFGTGYSSLTYLQSLPVGTLKIDKSFIDRILSDAGQIQFVSSIIHMAHVLGLCVVAEGVETEEQQQKLAGCKCDYIQGFVFSRPVVEKEAVLLLEPVPETTYT